MNQRIFDIIAFSIQRIEKYQDWKAFDELVLNSQSHPGQLEFLNGSVFKENALHPGNGWGKSKVLAKKHIKNILKHYADGKKYKTLNIAITIDQAELVQDEIVNLVVNSPMLSGWLIEKDGITKHPTPTIRYSNGARTEFKTTKKKGESVEGKEYGYISADEIALELYLEFIRDKILLPRLRAWGDSQMDFSATPKGMNAYYRVVVDIKRKGGYVRGGSSYENPWIDHNLLDYQCSTWSSAKVEQIVKGKFIDTAEMMFSSRVDKLFNNSLSLCEVERGHKYIEMWDLARGRKGSLSDQTVGYRIDVTLKPHRIVKRWAFQLPWTEKERENINKELGKEVERSSTEREIRNAQYASGADVYLDSTGIGDTLYGILQDIAKPIDFRGGNKDKILDHLQAVIDATLLESPFIPELADQMTVYQRDDKNLDTDDIMSLAVGCSAIKIKKSNFGTVAG
ncbi:MAG TPA: hypothetical protein ENH35_05765 [Candidatus Moranbacteria bacterium]|nr:hypothetical protein [Candidatus Moranbacteria bacterium]